MSDAPIRAVLWDFGGVILTSPFDAFNRYEGDRGLPANFIRSVNATNPHENAWARLERNDISADGFDALFADESAALGHRIGGSDVLALLAGDIRPTMVTALDRVIEAGYATACLTNNVVSGDEHDLSERGTALAEVMNRFDCVVESSKVGVRKPEPEFYRLACTMLGVDAQCCVFLDDLGINLKPARDMGMQTIKVLSADQAIEDLAALLDLDLR